ncbi:MAG: alpha-galactosidase [Sedimentisphaerales bacterium]|nr:alpha-galactosidase [Sedimentisphaerales bacterium]
MKLSCMSLLVLSLILIANPSSYAVEFSAITVFGCDDNGTQDNLARWNTGPVDACWDIFIYQGDIAKNADQIKWMNDPASRLVKFTPGDGSTTYTFHFDSSGELKRYGLNLFGENKNAPLISVYAPVSTDVSKPAPFKVNSSRSTMAWPIGDVPAAALLSYDGVEKALWICDDAKGGKRYTITDFKILTPEAAGNLDFVGSGETKPSGKADYVGQFTIKAENFTPTPPDWLLWSSTVAQMKIGPNNKDGNWKQKYDYQNAQPPFSFTYGGKSSRELLKSWKFDSEHKNLDNNRIAHNLTWQDPQTGLQIRWAGLEYTDFKSIEWTIYLTNTGKTDTSLLENINALDVNFIRGKGKEYNLRHWNGTFVTADDFGPKSTLLDTGKSLSFYPTGRSISTGGNWPYYNLETGDEGIILVVGWPGNWYANYQRDSDNGLHVTAGQKIAHFKLLPGEMVRSPLIVLQFWKGGDWIDAQNTWRQWMIRHNIPHQDGKQLPLPMFNACSSHQFAEMTKASEQNQKEFIDSYLNKGLKIDYWWMDAGWYVGAAEKGWTWTGTWEVDRRPNRFPNGLRAVSDYAHKKGVKTIVWFEPERVAGGTWLTTEHPEWVFGGAGGGLLNLGDPKAWDWLVNHIDKIIIDEGIDLYRQDYNIDPFPFWQKNDTEDRQGITENKYVMGYLAYWDELLRRHPGMLIDSCASGGHRNDLETMRRSIPLLRSDYLFEPVGQQGHTYGLSFWLPIHGTAYNPSNTAGWGWGTGEGISYGPYARRSNMCPTNTACFDFRVAVDDKLIMKLYNEWMEIGPNYYGDFYPLTEYNLSQKDWLAWQFYRPDAGEGFVQAFRRDQCVFRSAEIKLRGLDPTATYLLKNYDAKEPTRMSGKQLMETGMTIEIPEKPGAATIKYVKVK